MQWQEWKGEGTERDERFGWYFKMPPQELNGFHLALQSIANF